MSTIDAVLEFWFGPDPHDPPQDRQQRWFGKVDGFDDEIRERFGETWQQAAEGGLSEWEQSPSGAMALVLVLDQFSRNLWRGDPRSWSQDERVRGVMRRALDAGYAEELSPHELWFLMLPLMHSEHLPDQDEAVQRYTALRDAGGPDAVKWAVAHRDIVARFGRFPHRNAVLGRESTAEEVSFLQEPGSSL